MACNTVIYDFVNGRRVQLPTFSRAETVDGCGGRHGLRAILRPDDAAQALLRNHIRTLSELGRATTN